MRPCIDRVTADLRSVLRRRPAAGAGPVRPAVGGAVALAVVLAIAVIVVIGSNGTARPHRTVTAAAAPASRGELAVAINAAQARIDQPSSAPGELARAGQLEQSATATLAGEPSAVRRATLADLSGAAAAAMRANLAAAGALSVLSTAPRRLPPWHIIQPPPPNVLLGYYRAAGARFGVPWQDLAAIELTETRMGRVQGVSSAGARGPMQFMPATWARYGSGRINDQRDAIRSAGRYLAANGARRDLPAALYKYNNSLGYVHAVEDYAALMRANPRAYLGYYSWQVVYNRRGGAVILPVGYPKRRPEPLPRLTAPTAQRR
jgi:soluble lytic murein transglycosylase-like protein